MPANPDCHHLNRKEISRRRAVRCGVPKCHVHEKYTIHREQCLVCGAMLDVEYDGLDDPKITVTI